MDFVTGNKEIDGLLFSVLGLDLYRTKSVDIRYRHADLGDLAAHFVLVAKPNNDYWMTRTCEIYDAGLLEEPSRYHVYVDAKAVRDDDQDWLDGRVACLLRHEH